jgi:hypothetical protein
MWSYRVYGIYGTRAYHFLQQKSRLIGELIDQLHPVEGARAISPRVLTRNRTRGDRSLAHAQTVCAELACLTLAGKVFLRSGCSDGHGIRRFGQSERCRANADSG